MNIDTLYDLSASLATVFGDEWAALSASDRALILRDCAEDSDANDGRALDLAEYRRNIGPGNLQSYANVMRATFAKVDRQR